MQYMKEAENMNHEAEKEFFARQLKEFAGTLGERITSGGEWTIRGFIDIFRNIYTISSDTKIVSKVLELHLFPHFLSFAEKIGYRIELATYQNWYPDLSFIKISDSDIKFAVDLKTTYRDEKHPGFCNGFTLGSHGEYFSDRSSSKNIQHPYGEYSGHFCLGIIYSRAELDKNEETRIYSLEDLRTIPPIIKDFLFFAEEKWKIASDKGGSGNTANIESILKIDDILNGNGVFAKAGEEYFDNYWMNYGKIVVFNDGKNQKLSSFPDYLRFRGMPAELNNPMPPKRNVK